MGALVSGMRSGLWKLGASAAAVVGALVLVAVAARPGSSAGPCEVVNGPVMLPEIPEASGLAVSRRTPGVLWSHNDSGHAAVLFALNSAGADAGQVRVPVYTRDWEDVSAAQCRTGSCLYIADIGDNGLTRSRIQIYRVPEPSPRDSETARPETFNAAYSDGRHNAEAMFVIGEDLFIVTRDRTGGVYKATATVPVAGDLMFQRIGQLGLAAVTDAEASADGRTIVVRTDDEAVLYRTADFLGGTLVPYLRIPLAGLREQQGEGVALDGHTIYLASEGWRFHTAGRFVRLRCDWSD
jgi:hypothetical protein